MLKLDVYNERGKKTGKVKVDESVLGSRVRRRLLHQVVVAYTEGRHRGTGSAKTRAEVAGSGRKPWRQKGTGRSRQGDRRSPIWVGGGVAFPPKARSRRRHVTRSMKKEALKSALLSKFRDDEVMVVEPPEIDAPRTKRMASMLDALGIEGSCVLALPKDDHVLWKSSRNMRRVKVTAARNLNALDVLWGKKLLLAREVAENLAEVVK